MLTNKLKMGKEDISDQNIANLLLGDDGLVSYFVNLNERFADGTNDLGKLGDHGFFYNLAKRWFLIEKIGLVPCLNESKMGPMFYKIESLGPDPFARNWNDQASFDEALQALTTFDLVIKEISSTHDWHIMFKKIHEKVHTTQGVLGLAGAQDLQAKLLFAWIRYFQTHAVDRLPFPLNLASFFLGKKVSLSTMKDGWLALKLTDEDIRQIILYAEHEGFIGEEHKEWLEKALGVDLEMYVPKVATSIVLILILILITQSIKKAMKEEMKQEK